MNTTNITTANLAHFWGSENFYYHPMFAKGKIVYTDGVKFLNHNGAGWLVDLCLIHGVKLIAKEEFIHIELTVDLEKKSAIFTMDDGNDNIIYKQVIEYTDFPLTSIEMYLENGTLMLTSER